MNLTKMLLAMSFCFCLLVPTIVCGHMNQVQQQLVSDRELDCPQTPPATSALNLVAASSSGRVQKYVMKSSGDNGTMPDMLPGAEVGKLDSLTYTVCAYNNKKLSCEELLSPTEMSFTPFPTFINESTYKLDRGGVILQIPEAQNPFYFIPWFQTFVRVQVEGHGCGHDWSFNHLLHVNGAHVELLTSDDTTFCPRKPSIHDGILRWDDKDNTSGCRIVFHLQNYLNRPVSFGVVNLITKARNYLVIDGQQIPYLEINSTVLDAFWNHELDVYEIVNPKTNRWLDTWHSDFLEFSDNPSVSLGSGRWSAPGNKTGNYASIGFQYRFMTFVMQDWDETDNPNIKQIPVGRDNVVEWEILAQANLIDGTWEVDDTVSRLVQPPVSVQKPPFFGPVYTDYIQSGRFDRATYDSRMGDYVFKTDPFA